MFGSEDIGGGGSSDATGNIKFRDALINVLNGTNTRVEYNPKDGVEFSSSCKDIATVNSWGRVYANSKYSGETVITATRNGGSDSMTVIVPDSPLYNGVLEKFTEVGDLSIQPSVTFTELHFDIPPLEALEVGQTYSLSAVPYPIDLYGNGQAGNIPTYSIDWVSSNESVAKVKHGVIEPISVGNTTITAIINGTSVSCSMMIEVKERHIYGKNLMPIHADYVNDGKMLIGGTPSDAMEAIRGAITYAKENGYDGLLFDKMDFYIEPLDLAGTNIPSDFTLDFGFSTVRLTEWHDFVNGEKGDGTKTKAYRLFNFNGSEYACIRNMKFFGELYTYFFDRDNAQHKPSDYGEQTLFLNFDNARHCTIYNVDFEGIIGFNVAVGGSYWTQDYWKYPGGYTDSNIDYTNWVSGKMRSDGSIENNPNWISVENVVPFSNYFFPTHLVGTTYNADLGPIFRRNRFYNIAFYDSSGQIIEYDEWRYTWRTYKTPEGATGYRISVPLPDVPTNNESIRGASFTARMMSKGSTYMCSMHNCTCGYNFSGICSVVENAENFRIYNCYVSKNGSVNPWEFDIEDCWYEGFGSIVKNNRFGLTCAVSGVNSAWIDNDYTNSLYTRRTDGLKILNSNINYLMYCNTIYGVCDRWDKISSKVLSSNYPNYGHLHGMEVS